MTVILDAMGGDHAPAAIVRGAIEAARDTYEGAYKAYLKGKVAAQNK